MQRLPYLAKLYQNINTPYLKSLILGLTLVLSLTNNTLSYAQAIDSQQIDSLIENMSLEQKVGQCFIVVAYENPEQARLDQNEAMTLSETEKMVTNYQVGGVLFQRIWSPTVQASLANYYQSISSIPLFIAQDIEWGINMRIPTATYLPKNLALGAIDDVSLIKEVGAEVARQASLIGVNLALAPVVDVNCNSNNPVINDRSFGSNPYAVGRRASAWLSGFKDKGILACAKHFPGHGDTSVDSHYGLPTITHSRDRLDSVELVPFIRMIQEKVDCIMSAHICIPALGCAPSTPATLTKQIMSGMLREQLKFEGLAISDDLAMDAIRKHFTISEACVKAYEAGCDLLICSKEPEKAYQALLEAFQNKILDENELNARVHRILKTKAQIKIDRLIESPSYLQGSIQSIPQTNLNYRLFSNAVTLTTLRNIALPLVPLEGRTPICIDIGAHVNSQFYSTLSQMIPCNYHSLNTYFTESEMLKLMEKVPPYQTIILAIHSSNRAANQRYGLNPLLPNLTKMLLEKKCSVIVAIFANPYAASQFGHVHAIVFGYEDRPEAEKVAAEILTGQLIPKGSLPVKVETDWDWED